MQAMIIVSVVILSYNGVSVLYIFQHIAKRGGKWRFNMVHLTFQAMTIYSQYLTPGIKAEQWSYCGC